MKRARKPIPPAIELRKLTFAYENGPAVFRDLDLDLPSGGRILLVGANGVGKTTLLDLLAGHHLVPREAIRIFGRSPFYEPTSASEITLIDGDFPLNVDLKVREPLSHGAEGVDPRRQKELAELLQIHPEWRMCHVSEGQRRRVQLLLRLRTPCRLLLLDEVTANLDLVARADFLGWLRKENEKTGLTIIYTTHILDGLWTDRRKPWPTHLLFMSFRKKPRLQRIEEIRSQSLSPLLAVCEARMRKDIG